MSTVVGPEEEVVSKEQILLGQPFLFGAQNMLWEYAGTK